MAKNAHLIFRLGLAEAGQKLITCSNANNKRQSHIHTHTHSYHGCCCFDFSLLWTCCASQRNITTTTTKIGLASLNHLTCMHMLKCLTTTSKPHSLIFFFFSTRFSAEVDFYSFWYLPSFCVLRFITIILLRVFLNSRDFITSFDSRRKFVFATIMSKKKTTTFHSWKPKNVSHEFNAAH